MYIRRAIEETLHKASEQSKVVLLTGARQVGKSTVMRATFPDYTYVTLDSENELKTALEDRSLFFRYKSLPIIVDEVQYAPSLFSEIKRMADASDQKGQVFLTGSETYELMSSAAESLAGRVSILELSGLSMREINRVPFSSPFLPTEEYLRNRKNCLIQYENLWETIHRGSMPELQDPKRDWEWYYRDYVRTYLERDVRRIIQVKDEIKFRTFLTCIAARSGSLLVYSEVAKEVGADIKTIQSWTSVLAASGLIRILRPYQNNAIRRAIKTPKVFMMDTGLLCYLVGWNTPDSARNGAMAGSIFETFVISEILKSYINCGKGTDGFFFYRDKDGKEIDLLIEDGMTLYPIEIKKGATVTKDWTKNLSSLDAISERTIVQKTVLCLADQVTPIDEDTVAVPLEYI